MAADPHAMLVRSPAWDDQEAQRRINRAFELLLALRGSEEHGATDRGEPPTREETAAGQDSAHPQK